MFPFAVVPRGNEKVEEKERPMAGIDSHQPETKQGRFGRFYSLNSKHQESKYPHTERTKKRQETLSCKPRPTRSSLDVGKALQQYSPTECSTTVACRSRNTQSRTHRYNETQEFTGENTLLSEQSTHKVLLSNQPTPPHLRLSHAGIRRYPGCGQAVCRDSLLACPLSSPLARNNR